MMIILFNPVLEEIHVHCYHQIVLN